MSIQSLQLFSLTKTLLFPTNCGSGKLHLTRMAVLQGRHNVYQDETSQETHFLYPLIRMKRGTGFMKGCALGSDPCAVISCYLPERRGLFGFGGWGESFHLIFQSSCSSSAGWLPMCYSAICAVHSLVVIVPHSAFGRTESISGFYEHFVPPYTSVKPTAVVFGRRFLIKKI